MPAVRLTISGRVHGVGFRAFIEREAQKRGIRGWVRNRRDGTVETLLIGEAALVAEMEAACRRGPVFARVTAAERVETVDDGSPDFVQRPTE